MVMGCNEASNINSHDILPPPPPPPNHTHTFLLLQCQLDSPDTGKPLDTLTSQAQQYIKDLGSRNTKVSEIIGPKDQAVFTAIQEGLDKVNESATSQAKRVGIMYCSLLSRRVGQ